MKTLLKISWRNVWRNTRRSLVMIIAIAIGLWGGIFVSALSSGLIDQRFNLSVKQHISHIQIHHEDFLKDRHVKFSIDEWTELRAMLESDASVVAFSGRTLADGMLATASMTVGVGIIGVDADMEANTSGLVNNVMEGSYFDEEWRNPVLVGKKLADKIKVQEGSRLVLTFQNADSELVAAAFRVAGIYRTSNTMLDERNVYVLQSDLVSYIGQHTIINEVALLTDELERVDELKDKYVSHFPALSIRTWSEISPELAYMQEMAQAMLFFVIAIILFALAFGLVNTMLMSVFERTRELGMLMAVGMNRRRVFGMIMFETTFLTFIGAIGGVVLSLVSIQLFKTTGIDLSAVGGDSLNDFGFPSVIYPQLQVSFFGMLLVLVVITALLTSIYPALKALRLKPAEAVRKE
jgi:putative ABC transport system permease protein